MTNSNADTSLLQRPIFNDSKCPEGMLRPGEPPLANNYRGAIDGSSHLRHSTCALTQYIEQGEFIDSPDLPFHLVRAGQGSSDTCKVPRAFHLQLPSNVDTIWASKRRGKRCTLRKNIAHRAIQGCEVERLRTDCKKVWPDLEGATPRDTTCTSNDAPPTKPLGMVGPHEKNGRKPLASELQT